MRRHILTEELLQLPVAVARLVLQRQFKVGCPRMPGGQRGVSRESG